MDSKTSIPVLAAMLIVSVIAGVSGWVMYDRSKDDARAATPPGEASREEGVERARVAPMAAAVSPPPPMSVEDMNATMAANEAAAQALGEAGERKLRTQYEDERVDAAWASRKQQALEQLSVSRQIEELKAQPTSITANCRASICMIDAEFPSPRAAEDWFTLYTLNAGQEMSNASSNRTINPDGSVRLKIYGLARQ